MKIIFLDFVFNTSQQLLLIEKLEEISLNKSIISWIIIHEMVDLFTKRQQQYVSLGSALNILVICSTGASQLDLQCTKVVNKADKIKSH